MVEMLVYLPMDSKAVDHDREALSRGNVAEALYEDKDGGHLGVVESGIMTDDGEVKKDVDVWNFV